MSNVIKSIQVLSLTALLGAGVVTYTNAPKVEAQADKITICHGAGQDDTTQFVTLTLATNAVYQNQGNGGHFYENGTPKAGHEQDYLGECRTASVSPSASPSVSPSVSPSSSPSSNPSSTPTPPTALPHLQTMTVVQSRENQSAH